MNTRTSNVSSSLIAGLVGAVGVTLLNETVRHVAPNSRHVPHMDAIGENALAKTMQLVGARPPRRTEKLYGYAMAGDLVTNSLFYALVGRAPGAWLRGAFLGTLAGVGAALLPPMMGITDARDTKTSRANKFLTCAYYMTGGLVAALASQLIGDAQRDRLARRWT